LTFSIFLEAMMAACPDYPSFKALPTFQVWQEGGLAFLERSVERWFRWKYFQEPLWFQEDDEHTYR